MKTPAKFLTLSSFLIVSACGQAETLPVEVSLTHQGSTPVLYVEGITDRVKIISYQVNRGNCQASSIHRMPIDIIFGGKLQIIAPMCNVKEISLNTDLGSFVYSF